MSSLPSISYAKELGLLGSGLLSGGNLYISLFAVPSLLSHSQIPSNILHKQWHHIYTTGKAAFPVVSIVTAAAFGFVSLYSPNSQERLLFEVSALSTLAIIPFTLLGMRKNLGALLEERKTWDDSDNQNLRDLIKDWKRLNFVRAGFLIVGFVTAVAASVN